MARSCEVRRWLLWISVGITLAFASLTTGLWAGEPLRFEAEDVVVTKGAWQSQSVQRGQMEPLVLTDKDADKKWSGGVVLAVTARAPPTARHPRRGRRRCTPSSKSCHPGSTSSGSVVSPVRWASLSTARIGGRLTAVAGVWDRSRLGRTASELWVDDRYAHAKSPGSCYYDYIELTPLPSPTRKPKIQGFATTRVEDELDRALVALPAGEDKIYLSWRLLKDDPTDIAFDVYRQIKGGQPTKLNDQPIAKTTDFTDNNPLAGSVNEYTVVPTAAGKKGTASKPARATPAKELCSYKSIKLQGDYSFQKCGIADLNGDGVYDYVIKQPGANIDPYVKYWKRSPETYKLEAYLADGTFLWRHDMGWAIERGIWYSPMVVFDL